MLWTAGAAHWSLQCATRQHLALASFDAFLQRWIKLVERVSGWQGLSRRADNYLSFKNVLLQFQTSSALPVEKLAITRLEPTTPEWEKKRHRAEHKQQLAAEANLVLEQLESQGYGIAWTDGLAKWEGGTGWVGGYGATILGEWEESAPLPACMKQTINRAELMAVITVIERFGSSHRHIAVAMDSEHVYSGLQVAAARWKMNGWVSSSGHVLNVDLWTTPLNLVESSCAIWHWVKIPCHAGLQGNEVANTLANTGRLMS